MHEIVLTIIIPFLNEKEEVINTVKSIRNNSNSEKITILLINDASDDGFDYRGIAEKYNTEYILNHKRLGVAASRDLGVRKSRTPYVMFLDAHMRFYNNIWIDRIINELRQDTKVLLCCQTKGLMLVDGEVIEIKNRPPSFGACIDIYNEKRLLECKWIFNENESDSHTIRIPCVLGAAYSCSREYWLYLKGLNGLMYYGNDESYISIKVYLEGGSCKLLKDIVVGHIYRDYPPYNLENTYRLYNRFLIAELLLPESHKARIFSQISKFDHYEDALFILYKNRKKIHLLKKYYNKILKYGFSYFEKLNNQFHTFIDIVENKEELLRNITHHIILNNNLIPEIGLLSGKLGIVIFLFHYGHYSNNDIYNQFSEEILDNILDNITNDIPLNFHDGLIGIGWGIEYLYQNRFIQGDINDILEEIDKKILEFDTTIIEDLNLNNGLGGIFHYILSRLYTIEKENRKNPFNFNFLSKLYKTAVNILDNNKNSDSLAIFIRYVMFFEKITVIQQPSIYDIMYLKIPQDYQFKKFVSGLDGNASVGLKLIFEKLK
jgi:hypothetical protein